MLRMNATAFMNDEASEQSHFPLQRQIGNDVPCPAGITNKCSVSASRSNRRGVVRCKHYWTDGVSQSAISSVAGPSRIPLTEARCIDFFNFTNIELYGRWYRSSLDNLPFDRSTCSMLHSYVADSK